MLRAASVMLIHLFVIYLATGNAQGLTVTAIRNCTIETYLTLVDFEGIRYSKRELNTSVEASMEFAVSPITELNDLSLNWLFGVSKLTVRRVMGNAEPENSDVYTTEKLDAVTSTATITLHLKEKGLASGNYTLVATYAGTSAAGSSFASAPPILPVFPKTKRVLEGDVLRLMCHPSGYPKPEAVLWSFSPLTVDQMEDSNAIVAASTQLTALEVNETRYELKTSEDGVPNDTLRFTQLLLKDNGLYACNVSNIHGSDLTYVLVNVKDRWAALWPFIGIVIEVAVLVTAILLYERHQMRSKPTKLDVSAGPTEASSPSAKQRSAALSQQQQQNSAATGNAVVMGHDTDCNKMDNAEVKTEELRQRDAQRC